MSTPNERSLCVVQTRRFLQSLRSDDTLPEPVRQESHRLLRHYPTATDIQTEALLQEKGMRGMCFDPEIDPGWWREYLYGPVTKEST
ncbi:BPSL0761 family protein [Lysobacter sp. A289]